MKGGLRQDPNKPGPVVVDGQVWPLVVSFGDWALDRTKCEEHSATFNYRIAKRFIRSLRRREKRDDNMTSHSTRG